MIFKKGELLHLYPFYTYYAILGLTSMITPFLFFYFVDLGFSFFQISILFFSMSASMFLFEIPTGAFADGYSRKRSVILGACIAGFSILLMGVSSNYFILLAAFIVAGFGMTFVSGAEEAWIIDNLNYHKREDLHTEFFIKSQSILSIARVFAPLIGAFVVKAYTIQPLWFVWSLGFFGAAIMIMLFSNEHYKPKKVSIKSSISETIHTTKKGLNYTYKHTQVLLLVLASIFLAMMIVDEDYWQPFLTDLGMPIYALGFVYAIVAAVGALVPFTARYLEKYNVKNVFIILTLARTLLLLLVIPLVPPMFMVAIIIFIISEGLVTLRHPLLSAYFQKQIPKKVRATITSVKSMATQVGLGIGGLLVGFLADIIGAQLIIPLTGFFGIAAIYCFWRMKN